MTCSPLIVLASRCSSSARTGCRTASTAADALDVPHQSHDGLPAGHVPFLDVLLVPQIRPTPPPLDALQACFSMRIVTRLYGKRVQPLFARVRLTRFIHASSNVAEQSRCGLLAGQFHRLRRIVTDFDNFVEDIAHIIANLARSG